MPKRNYGFEKRQKEIARKLKQEDKKKRKLERPQDPPDETLTDATGAADLPPQE